MDTTIKLFLALVVVLFTNCSGEKPESKGCAFFKNGEFSYTESSTVRIIRKDSLQIEYSIDPQNPFQDTSIVTWKSPCVYYLSYKGSSNKESLDWDTSEPIKVEIVKIQKNRYWFTASTSKFTKENQLIKLR